MIQCSKMVSFNRTEAGLTSKFGRILPAVQECYQNQSNCIMRQCISLAMSLRNWLHRDKHTGTQSQTKRIMD